MKNFDKHKLIITVVFFILAYLNFYNLVHIEYYGVFGLTFGALLICISTCFEGKFIIFNIDIWWLLKNILYLGGWIFIVVGVYLKKNIFFEGLINTFNGNTLMFLSLGFTFLSLLVSDLKSKKQKKQLDIEKKELDNIIKEQIKRQNQLNDIIKKIKNQKMGDSNEK